MNFKPLALTLLTFSLSFVNFAFADIPQSLQDRILAKAPQADGNGDGNVTIEELKKLYPSLPAQVQQALLTRMPELGEGRPTPTPKTTPPNGPTDANVTRFNRPAGDPLVGRKEGYNCLFMGHSYFVHMVKNVAHHAENLGLKNHEQVVVFHGGVNGAPGNLWNSTKRDVAEAKELLTGGNVELLALTYHDVGSDLIDYKRWIDLALEHNSKTVFVIQAPWPTKKSKQFEEYETQAKENQRNIHSLIDQLRKEYPETIFMAVPQCLWMVELWKLYDDQKLPELTEFVANTRPAPNALFRDDFGHGGELAENEGVFLWLNVIYGIDLNAYKCETKTEYDLKALSQNICESDPYTKFPE
ncbi:MAG: hypothetical protein AAGH89_05450 [Verrucomicrobiota bacterium]